jgi:pimeloyl-ACP methyl ester carboxylesterase
VPAKNGDGKVHKGFSDALDEVWPELCDYVALLHTGGRTVWFAGHSLGAALATLAAARYGKAQGVYTFGSPRVGDATFRDRYPVPLYRVVNGHDVITTVPLPPLYRHVGELWYLDSQGELQHDTRNLDLVTDGIRGEAQNIAESVRQIRQGKFLYIPGGFKDHIPLLYAIHLWNNLVK